MPRTTVHVQKTAEVGHKDLVIGDFVSKFMYNFDIYCSQNLGNARGVGRGRRETTMAHEVITKLTTSLQNVGHYITMDNYFTSILLLVEFASKGIYGTVIVRINCIGLPSHLKNAKAFKKVPQ